MTTITENNGMIKVNGRSVYVWGVESLNKIRAGRWEIIRKDGEKIVICGGSAAGGSSREWFVEWELAFGPYPARYNSAIACLEAIDRV